MKTKDYMVTDLFRNCTDTFSLYELVENNNEKQDLRILAVNQVFSDLTSVDLKTLLGRLFIDACKSALDWLPFYMEAFINETNSKNTAEFIYLLDQRRISVLNVDLNKTRLSNSLNITGGGK